MNLCLHLTHKSSFPGRSTIALPMAIRSDIAMSWLLFTYRSKQSSRSVHPCGQGCSQELNRLQNILKIELKWVHFLFFLDPIFFPVFGGSLSSLSGWLKLRLNRLPSKLLQET